MGLSVLDRERVPPPNVTPGAPGPWERLIGQAMVPVVLVFVAWPFVLSGGRSPWWSLLAPLVLLLALLLMSGAGRKRDAREIMQARYRACLRCRYDLSALPPEGECPECGGSYTHAHSERSWRWTYQREGEGTGI